MQLFHSFLIMCSTKLLNYNIVSIVFPLILFNLFSIINSYENDTDHMCITFERYAKGNDNNSLLHSIYLFFFFYFHLQEKQRMLVK